MDDSSKPQSHYSSENHKHMQFITVQSLVGQNDPARARVTVNDHPSLLTTMKRSGILSIQNFSMKR